jgi:hypothetical protein
LALIGWVSGTNTATTPEDTGLEVHGSWVVCRYRYFTAFRKTGIFVSNLFGISKEKKKNSFS